MNIVDSIKLIRKRKVAQDGIVFTEALKISAVGIVMSIADAIENKDNIKSKKMLNKVFSDIKNFVVRHDKDDKLGLEIGEEEKSVWGAIGDLIEQGAWSILKTVAKSLGSFVLNAIKYTIVPVFEIFVSTVALAIELAVANPISAGLITAAVLGYGAYRILRTEPTEYEKEGGPLIPFALDRTNKYATAVAASGLERVITKGESNFDYNAANVYRGRVYANITGEYKLTEMTVGEIMALQDQHKLNAVGKFQVIPTTLKSAVAALGIPSSAKFDEALQERMFSQYLLASKRPDVYNYITGKVGDTETNIINAGIALSQEWRALADPRTGRTYDDPDAKYNRSSVPWADIKAALMSARNLYAHPEQVLPSATSMMSPVDGRISSQFGNRNNPMGRGSEFHPGIDFAVPIGTPVKASASGIVVKAGPSQGFGNLVQIDHGNSLLTQYGHLSFISTSVGAKVSQSQVIAKSGNEGRSTGPHLHFGVISSGKPVDPAPYIGVVSAATPAPKVESRMNESTEQRQIPMVTKQVDYVNSNGRLIRIN